MHRAAAAVPSSMAPIAQVLLTREREIAPGFAVKRVLPAAHRRTVGPFTFLDHMGPLVIPAGEPTGDIPPHPHIGLATLTYLFEGEVVHKDSLGSLQTIRPGDVNWMNAGAGVVHSERVAPAQRAAGFRLHGLQLWAALPLDREEMAPTFEHQPRAALPVVRRGGAELTVVAGAAFGAVSPLTVPGELFFVDARVAAGGELEVAPAALGAPARQPQAGLYLVEGEIEVDAVRYPAPALLLAAPGQPLSLRTAGGARAVLLGGAALTEPRHMWWNFVSSSRARIEAAKQRWRDHGFPSVPGETERVPLPEG